MAARTSIHEQSEGTAQTSPSTRRAKQRQLLEERRADPAQLASSVKRRQQRRAVIRDVEKRRPPYQERQRRSSQRAPLNATIQPTPRGQPHRRRPTVGRDPASSDQAVIGEVTQSPRHGCGTHACRVTQLARSQPEFSGHRQHQLNITIAGVSATERIRGDPSQADGKAVGQHETLQQVCTIARNPPSGPHHAFTSTRAQTHGGGPARVPRTFFTPVAPKVADSARRRGARTELGASHTPVELLYVSASHTQPPVFLFGHNAHDERHPAMHVSSLSARP